MNYDEWHNLVRNKTSELVFTYYNKVKSIQKSLKYNSDPNAKIIHHLRDTEEQRKYNDEHYEFWGFEIDENGNEHFEYGKYVVFVTDEEHGKLHSFSEETREKISDGVKRAILANPNDHDRRVENAKQLWRDENYRARRREISNDPEYRKKISERVKKSMTDDMRAQLSEKSKALWQDEEYRNKTVAAIRASITDERREQLRQQNLGRKHSEETKKRWSEQRKGRKLNLSDEVRKQASDLMKERLSDPEFKSKLYNEEVNNKRRDSIKKAYANMSDDRRKEISQKRSITLNSPEVKEKIKQLIKAAWTDDKRKAKSNEQKEIFSEMSDAYKKYIADGGTAKWNEFRKMYWESKKVTKDSKDSI
jgi:hypothetical protein